MVLPKKGKLKICGDLYVKVTKKSITLLVVRQNCKNYFKFLGILQIGITSILCLFDVLYLVNI